MKPVVISENILNFNEESSAPIRVTEGTYAASVTGTAVPPDKGDDWEGAIIFRFRIEGGPAGYAQSEGLGAGISIYCDLSEKGVFKFGQTLAGIGFPQSVIQSIIGTRLGDDTVKPYDALKAYAAQIGVKCKGHKVGLEIIDSTYRVGQSDIYQVVKYAVYEEKVKAIPPVAVAPTPPAPVAAAAATPVAAPSNGQADLAATVAASLDNFSL